MKRSLHWLQRQTRLSSLLLLAAGTEDEDCGVVVAVEAAGPGVFPLETDERLSCVDDMDIVDLGLVGCEENKDTDPDCLGTVEKSQGVRQGQMVVGPDYVVVLGCTSSLVMGRCEGC